jgi:Flp pilus assembly protein TadD
MPRSIPRLVVLLLAASALTGCTGLSGTPKAVAAPDKAQPQKAVANDIEGNLRQARLLRAAGSYDDAIHILSQLMLAAADDPRVTAEYGKALAQKGRAQDATQFLRRAIELSPGDWTLYSALGVSYDQLGDQPNARLAYEHALMLRPNEASVLNTYALSRMLAKDPDGARALIARAQTAAGPSPNAKIARNVALIDSMAPQKAAAAEKPVAAAAAPKAAAPAPAPVKTAPKLAIAAPQTPVAAAPLPKPNGPQNAGDVARLLASQNPVANAPATSAPRPLAPQVAAAQPPRPQAAPSGVVMQAVPYDPYAGPVARKKPKTVAQTDTHKADAPLPKPQQAAAAKPGVVPALRVATGGY